MSSLEDDTGTEGLITGKWYVLSVQSKLGGYRRKIVSGPYDDRATAARNCNRMTDDFVRRWKGKFWRAS